MNRNLTRIEKLEARRRFRERIEIVGKQQRDAVVAAALRAWTENGEPIEIADKDPRSLAAIAAARRADN